MFNTVDFDRVCICLHVVTEWLVYYRSLYTCTDDFQSLVFTSCRFLPRGMAFIMLPSSKGAGSEGLSVSSVPWEAAAPEGVSFLSETDEVRGIITIALSGFSSSPCV